MNNAWCDLRTVSPAQSRRNGPSSAGRNGTIRIWRLPSGEAERDIRADHRRIRSIAFSPGGERLASAGDGETVRIWNVSTGEKQLELPARPAKVMAIVFAFEKKIYVGGTDNAIRQWNLTIGQPALQPPRPHWTDLRWRATPRSIGLFPASFDTTIRIWDLPQNRTH